MQSILGSGLVGLSIALIRYGNADWKVIVGGMLLIFGIDLMINDGLSELKARIEMLEK